MIHINTCSFCDCMHSTSKIIDILRADSCHRNTRIFGQINTEVLRYFFNLKKYVLDQDGCSSWVRFDDQGEILFKTQPRKSDVLRFLVTVRPRGLYTVYCPTIESLKSFFHFKLFLSDFIGIDFVLCDERVRLTNVKREAPFPSLVWSPAEVAWLCPWSRYNRPGVSSVVSLGW